MHYTLFTLLLFLFSFTPAGGGDLINDKVIYKELKEKHGYESYLDIGKFGNSEYLKFYGFSNVSDVNFLILKLNSLEKRGGIEGMVKFMGNLYPNRNEVNFTRNDYFCIILFDPAKEKEALNIKETLDKLIFRST